MKYPIIIPEEIFYKLPKEAQQILFLGDDPRDDRYQHLVSASTEVLIYRGENRRHIHNTLVILKELIAADDMKDELEKLRELKKSVETIKKVFDGKVGL